jgi:hypothetical protein
MTYCAGWKYADTVFLLGDTAATKLSRPTTPQSSFGELHAEVRGKHVEEMLLKLVPIAPGTAVAFAGDVQLASEIIGFLKSNYDETTPLDSLFSSLVASLGPFDPERAVELILASSSSGAGSYLVHWDTVHGLNARASDYYQIGSLTSYHAALTPQVLSVLAAGKVPPERLLPILTAVVQSYGVHDNLINMNVGGVIFGLRVHAGGLSWQDDTNYVLYDPSFANVVYVSAFVRENALVVSSSLTNDVRILAHSVSTPSSQVWLSSWETYIKTHLSSDQYRYWVFLRTLGKVITVIRREALDRQSRYMRLDATGDGKFTIGMSPELMPILTKSLVDRGDESLPFRLNFLND